MLRMLFSDDYLVLRAIEGCIQIYFRLEVGFVEFSGLIKDSSDHTSGSNIFGQESSSINIDADAIARSEIVIFTCSMSYALQYVSPLG